MENSFKTLQDAVDSWNWDKTWKSSKDFFTRNMNNNRRSCCVCFHEGRYFIITHPLCVGYRERKKQVVMYLDFKADQSHYYPQYLTREDVYNRAVDELDLSNPEVDQEMRMGELMGLTYLEDLGLWFDEEVEHE